MDKLLKEMNARMMMNYHNLCTEPLCGTTKTAINTIVKLNNKRENGKN